MGGRWIYYFFFFQAEDGIRVRNVTGVQTCALPISFHERHLLRWPVVEHHATPARTSDSARIGSRVTRTPRPRTASATALAIAAGAPIVRSEERRVGKECRARRWPEPSKKK